MRKVIPILFVALLSCSTAEADKNWKIDDVSDAEKEWRFCDERLDGPDKKDKGFCYISRECYKTIFGNQRCRPLPLFCAWGDLGCYEKFKLKSKKLR